MKELTELTEKQWLERMEQDPSRQALLFVTPLCGTCKVSERMLQVVQASDKAIPIHKININYAVSLRTKWRIASVPCLAIVEHGELVTLEYAMGGVDHLYERLKR